jgi:twitching motility protein PilT
MAIQQTTDLERALQAAADRKASDVYLMPDEPIAFRISDQVVRSDADALSAVHVRTIAAAAVGDDRLAQIGKETGRIITSCGLPGVIQGQMCIASSRGEIGIVVSLLTSTFISVEEARIPESMLRAAESRGGGLLIFSGRVGSGKTTTMLSVIEHLNATQARHICTVEDPLHAVFTPKQSLVTQREVGVDGPDTLSCIAASMGQDPDVLLVGELKSAEEIQACLTAAYAGVLVITQLHAPTPERAIQRLVDAQPPEHVDVFRRQLAEVLRGVSAQVLMPRADGTGRVPAYGVLIPDAETRKAITRREVLGNHQPPLPPGSRDLSNDIDQLRRDGLVTDAAARAALDSLF